MCVVDLLILKVFEQPYGIVNFSERIFLKVNRNKIIIQKLFQWTTLHNLTVKRNLILITTNVEIWH